MGLGPDDATGIALTKNGTTLEIRKAGVGGRLIPISASNIGGAGVFATLVVGTDPGGGDIVRIGGSVTVVTVHASGDGKFSGKFGTNGAAVQGAAASGGALAGYATGVFGLDSDANMHALYTLVATIRAALVANGI